VIRNIIMKNAGTKLIKQGLFVVMGLSVTVVSVADQRADDYQQLENEVKAACPARFEALTTELDDTILLNDLWGDATQTESADRDAFISQFNADNTPTDLERSEVLGSVAAINFECNSYRLAMLTLLLETNNEDSAASLQVARGVANAIDYPGNRWQAGDVRVTARPAPARQMDGCLWTVQLLARSSRMLIYGTINTKHYSS